MSSEPPPIPRPMQVIPVAAYAGSPSGAYSNTRPGSIMFLAVTGLIVAVFGALFSGYFLLVMTFVANMAAPRPVTAGPAIAPTTGPIWTVAQGAQVETHDGVSAVQERVMLDGMLSKHPISTERRKLLGNLIRKHGDVILDLPAGDPTPAYVSGLIVDAGETDDKSADYFVFSNGRVQVSDQSAVFRPSEGRDAYEVKSKEDLQLGNALSATQIQQLMSTINVGAGANAAVNPAQRAAMQKYLSDPAQELFVRIPNLSLALSVSAFAQGDNEVMFYSTTGSWVMMDTQGNITATPRKPAAAWGGPLGRGKSIPKGFIQLSTIESVLSILLSVMLFVLSIMTMRQHSKTRRWLIWFALLKVMCVLIGIAALYQLVNNTGIWSRSGVVTTIVIYAAVALLYPVLVLIFMNMRAVKNFYSSVGG